MAKAPRAEDRTDQKEDFLRRWSRRKTSAAERDATSHEPVPAEPPVAVQPEPEPPAKTDADMPPIDSIDESTDMRDFFSPEVSDKLRQVALRKLFHLPKFNVVDGLDDYDDDFTDFAPLGDMITSDMRHQMEMEKERLAAAQAEEDGDENIEEVGTPEQELLQTELNQATEASHSSEQPGGENQSEDQDEDDEQQHS